MSRFKLPKDRGYMGDPRRGASLGRPCRNEFMATPGAAPFRLVRIYLDAGGYDNGGAYWGHGEPLYYYEGPLTDLNGFVRGHTREAAKAEVRRMQPHAQFFR